jgi:hypothetical protein
LASSIRTLVQVVAILLLLVKSFVDDEGGCVNLGGVEGRNGLQLGGQEGQWVMLMGEILALVICSSHFEWKMLR